jgi:hypothetical protein
MLLAMQAGEVWCGATSVALKTLTGAQPAESTRRERGREDFCGVLPRNAMVPLLDGRCLCQTVQRRS